MRLPLLLVLSLMSASFAQDPPAADTEKKERRLGPAERDLEEPGVKINDPAVARDKVKRFEEKYKGTKDQFKKADAVKDLGGFDHPVIRKKLKRLAKDKNRFVAIEAIFACARQSDTAKVARQLHGQLKSEKRTDLVCALLVSLGKIGYPKAEKEAKKWFTRDTKTTHLAATRYLGSIQAKAYFRRIAEKLDYPRPADPDSPTNPSASWWKDRYEEWEINLPYTQWALSRLVPGETFESVREARQFAKSRAGKKAGIEW